MNSRGALGAETGALPTDFGSALKFELFALFASSSDGGCMLRAIENGSRYGFGVVFFFKHSRR